jgi:hypothetical protein
MPIPWDKLLEIMNSSVEKEKYTMTDHIYVAAIQGRLLDMSNHEIKAALILASLKTSTAKQ